MIDRGKLIESRIKIVHVNNKYWVIKDRHGYVQLENQIHSFYTWNNPHDASWFSSKEDASRAAEEKWIPYKYPELSEHEYIPPSLVKKMESVTKENQQLKDKACAFDLLDKLIDADKRGDEEESRLISEELEAYWQEHGRTVKKGWFARIIERLAA